MEGLLAYLQILPADDKKMRPQVDAAVERGIEFLLKAQIAAGNYAGGIPRGVLGDASTTPSDGNDDADIRMDYVQHFLSAMLEYKDDMHTVTANPP